MLAVLSWAGCGRDGATKGGSSAAGGSGGAGAVPEVEPDGAAAEGAGSRPRISAEHPVTSPAARRAGLLEEGVLDPGGVGHGDGRAASEETATGPVVVVLPARDLDRSLDFYRALLAFDLLAIEPAEPPFERLELVPPQGADGTVSLRLVLVAADELAAQDFPSRSSSPEAGAGQPSGSGTGRSSGRAAAELGGTTGGLAVLSWPVEDLDGVARRLADAGVVVAERPTDDGGRSLALSDPSGNRLLLREAGSP